MRGEILQIIGPHAGALDYIGLTSTQELITVVARNDFYFDRGHRVCVLG